MKKEYTYDALDRLIYERDYDRQRIYQTVYLPNSGNIHYTVEYDFNWVSQGSRMYNYGNAWGDLLTSYNGQAITYDNAGNPLSYRGMGMQWQNGKQLKQITGASYGNNWGTITMEYDYSGLRTKKSRTGGVNNCDQYYYWQGNQLIAEEHGGLFLYYYYDETGVCGFNRGGTDFYFQKNIFGDIIAIYSANGTLVGSYTYDAWGNTTVTNNTGDAIASWNPFRYRGYYQDQETGFYYLQSRYYDPQTGRFINADDPTMAYLGVGTVQGANLFAYCNNNPVMNVDPTGHAWYNPATWDWNAIGGWTALTVGVAFAIGFTCMGASASRYNTFSGAIMFGAGFGFLAGMIVSEAKDGGGDPWRLFYAGLKGAAAGAICAAFSFTFAKIGSEMGLTFGYNFSKMLIMGRTASNILSISVPTLMTVGGAAGTIAGGVFGGTIGYYASNQLFGDEADFLGTISGGVQGEIPSWIVSLFWWMFA